MVQGQTRYTNIGFVFFFCQIIGGSPAWWGSRFCSCDFYHTEKGEESRCICSCFSRKQGGFEFPQSQIKQGETKPCREERISVSTLIFEQNVSVNMAIFWLFIPLFSIGIGVMLL